MSKPFVLTLHLDNAAFEDNAGDALGEILEFVASVYRDGHTLQQVYDVNGNVCGSIDNGDLAENP